MEPRKGKNLEKTHKVQKREKIIRDKNIPFGREEVKTAILNATEKLLLERSPIEITVREIAKLANIKHPLIHRHFGTKEEVIKAVHTRQLEKIIRNIPIVENLEGNLGLFFLSNKQNKWRQTALARAMIEGVNPHLLQDQFPVMQRLVKLMKKRHSQATSSNNFSPEFLTAALGALAAGWMLYEPFLLAATGLENEDKDEIQQKFIEILEEFVQKIC